MKNITFISDTHMTEPDLPGGDLLVHAGDMTYRGTQSEVYKQLNWLTEQLKKYKNVVVIPGNHDFYFERNPSGAKVDFASNGIHLLIHEAIEVDGVKIFGSPYTPWFHDWAFNRGRSFEEAALRNIPYIGGDWDQIPKDTQLLITHGPPYGILDATRRGELVGCEKLLKIVEEIKPAVHVFGHIHEGYGQKAHNGTLFINASVLDYRYVLINSPINVDWEELTRIS